MKGHFHFKIRFRRPAAVTSFIPHFLIPFSSIFFSIAGDIGQMNLPEGMQAVNFEECRGLTGTS